MENYSKEILLYVVALFTLIFVLTNVNQSLGNVYLAFGLIGLALLIINITVFDKKVQVTFQKTKGGWFESVFAAIIGWVAILGISYLAFNFVGEKTGFGAVITSLNAANPVFANSKIINLIVISFVVGFLETQLFARALEFASDRMKISITRANMFRLPFVLLTFFFAFIFVILHLTAKGVSNFPALVVVFIMMVISLGLIAYYNGETRQAVLMHVISNAVAALLLLSNGGALSFG